MIVVLGICHKCEEYTPLVKQEEYKKRLIYQCFHCHSQYEQMVNGKILFNYVDKKDLTEEEKKLKDEIDVIFEPEE